MKEKLSLILCLVAMAFGLAACGTDSANTEYYGTTYEELQSASENNIATLAALSDEEYEYYIEYGSDLTSALVSSWREATSGLGAYEGMGEFSVSKAQTTVTTEQTVFFENRNVVLTFVYEYSYEDKQLELEDANADLVYTMGEKMSKAGLNTLMGMGTVFCVLILISLVIYCFRFISSAQNRSKANAAPAPAQSRPSAAPAPMVQPQLTDDSELVAVIMAAIAAATGESEDSFVVRSIVRR
jgi:sodium pump decarboxylase gamma subunit